jgi:hypothetical protein
MIAVYDIASFNLTRFQFSYRLPHAIIAGGFGVSLAEAGSA